MSNDIKMQVTDQIRLSPFFSIQLDESTDVSIYQTFGLC